MTVREFLDRYDILLAGAAVAFGIMVLVAAPMFVLAWLDDGRCREEALRHGRSCRPGAVVERDGEDLICRCPVEVAR